jgi:hypothetical protein
MSYLPLQLANFASAFVWAAVVLLLGSMGASFLRWLWE